MTSCCSLCDMHARGAESKLAGLYTMLGLKMFECIIKKMMPTDIKQSLKAGDDPLKFSDPKLYLKQVVNNVKYIISQKVSKSTKLK